MAYATQNPGPENFPTNIKSGPSLSGDDIESAFDLIDRNGGLGQWEEGEPDRETTPRWLFPRFAGADEIGTCDVKTKAHAGIHKRVEKCGESFSPDMGNMYLSRTGVGPYDTDVETVAAWLAAPRNIVGGVMLLGEPGTGKTALAEAAVTHMDQTMVTHLCTPDDTRDSLFLRFVGEGKGEGGTPYVKGVVPRAVEAGHVLYMDEFMLLVDGVKPVFYQLSDGRASLAGGNVDGTDLPVHPNFRLIVSSNPSVRGASLPEPIGSRFASTTLTVETSATMLHDLNVDEAIVAAWEALGTAGLWRPQIREVRLADYWLGVDAGQAVSAMVPEHCPESQRSAVRNTVVSYLAGEIREDGRLVVS